MKVLIDFILVIISLWVIEKAITNWRIK